MAHIKQKASQHISQTYWPWSWGNFLFYFLLPNTMPLSPGVCLDGSSFKYKEHNGLRALFIRKCVNQSFHWKQMPSRRFRPKAFYHFSFSSTAHRTRCSAINPLVFFWGASPRVRALAAAGVFVLHTHCGSFSERPPAAVHYRILCAELRFMLLCAARELSARSLSS